LADIKKYIKKIFISAMCIFFAAAFVAVYPFGVSAQTISAEQNKISVSFNLPSGFSYTVNAYSKPLDEETLKSHDGYGKTAYILTLPYDMKNSYMKIFTEGATIYIADTEIFDGDEILLPQGIGYVVADGEKYIFEVMYTADIPQIYIDTQSGSMEYIHENKDNREKAAITIIEDGEIEYSGNLEYIKGRGNTSWRAEQKPYSIKLQSKANVFNMGVSKKYNLVATLIDDTFVRNKLAIDFAERAGVEFCPQSRFIDLYCNNEYMGLYLFAEKIEVEDGRVEIFDIDEITEQVNPGIKLDECPIVEEYYENGSAIGVGGYRYFDIPNDMAKDINGGYLLEMELYQRYKYRWVETGFISDYGQTVAIIDPQHISKEQIEYIRSYYQEFEDAVMSTDGYNTEGKHYTEYIDIEAAAKMYVLQEFTQNIDVGATSSFWYKDINGKITACSAWDFDFALGVDKIRDEYNISNTNNIWAAKRTLDPTDVNIEGRDATYTIFSLMWQHEDFRREAARQWENIFRNDIQWLLEKNIQLSEELHNSAISEICRWQQSDYAQAKENGEEYIKRIEKLNEYIIGRAEFLDGYLTSDANYVFYGKNGGEGVMIDAYTYTADRTAIVMENLYKNNNIEFTGWNTQPDGSGQWYYPGDSIEMKEEDVYLFAQWDGYTSSYVHHAPPAKNKTLLEILVDFFDKFI